MNFSKSKNRQDSIKIIDVKKGLSLAIVFAFLSVYGLNAQSAPEPPTPPKTTTTNGTSYSISIDNDDDETSNSSVSISISDDTYKFRSSFHKSKNAGVKTMLLKTLGKTNLKINGNTYLWSDSKSGDEVFECKLTKGHLRMHLDTDVASKGFLNKIQELGNDLKYYISGTDRKKEDAKKTEHAQRDLERAQRDLERAQRDLERAKRNTKRN
jgi:hypothetical protein|nr:hypothetical protein [uncultured Psychroserpens sp.]